MGHQRSRAFSIHGRRRTRTSSPDQATTRRRRPAIAIPGDQGEAKESFSGVANAASEAQQTAVLSLPNNNLRNLGGRSPCCQAINNRHHAICGGNAASCATGNCAAIESGIQRLNECMRLRSIYMTRCFTNPGHVIQILQRQAERGVCCLAAHVNGCNTSGC